MACGCRREGYTGVVVPRRDGLHHSPSCSGAGAALVQRLTPVEWGAVEHALNVSLAGIIDGVDEGSPDEARLRRAMERALVKVQERRTDPE